MITPKVQVKLNKAKLHAIVEAAERAHGSYVTVGWQDARTYPNGGPLIAQVAVWNEFGTYTAEHDPHVPARPFMRPTMAEKKADIKAVTADALQAVALRGWSVAKGLQMVGYRVQEYIRNKIKSNIQPELADSTAAARKRAGRGTNTLIDTGLMLNALTYKLHLHDGKAQKEYDDKVARQAQMGRDEQGHFLTKAKAAAQAAARAGGDPQHGRDEHGRFLKKAP